MKRITGIFTALALMACCLSNAAEAEKESGTGWKILRPGNQAKVYSIAAEEFQSYYKQITGITLEIVDRDDETSDMVVIGSDMVNLLARKCIEDKVIAPLGLGAQNDSYRILFANGDGRRFLFLSGGSGRATLYAVYDYFEREGGCRYFWDGDIVPSRDSLRMTGLDISESPRFGYRGTRYFAHRSLDRFQAEHWGRKEWEREITWLTKKRLNMFMLRIGMDDVFQKAFPDIVPYPDSTSTFPEAQPRSFYDRTTAWPLQYRGELRRYILQYARDRELMHPEDMGTMTHWYSMTPKAFIDAIKPSFNPQSGGAYQGNPVNAVWDIRDDRNLENYWKLTQTHIDCYGSPQLFHTIGIAERETYTVRADNLEMKLYAYKRMINKLRSHYPNAPLMIASWDFYLPGWKQEEVKILLEQLNKDNTIIMDYTSDLPNNSSNTYFGNWGVKGSFPYTFGIFHAYEWENDIKGYYANIEERLAEAKDDPMCKGFIYWPEMAHSDPLMLEFFTHNAWTPDCLAPEDILPQFCADRYGEYSDEMFRAWSAVLPVVRTANNLPLEFKDLRAFSEKPLTAESVVALERTLEEMEPVSASFDAVLEALAQAPYGKGNAFVDRDAIDLARTMLARQFTIRLYRHAVLRYRNMNGECRSSEVKAAAAAAGKTLLALRDILSLHDDYSMRLSYEKLKEEHSPLNPAFEQALKGNSGNDYCRTYISEYFDYYYIPQFNLYSDLSSGRKVKTSMQGIVDDFFSRPLADMKPLGSVSRDNASYRKIILSQKNSSRR